MADTYENELEIALRVMTNMIEPVLIIVMAVGVGFLLLSILLPMFNLFPASAREMNATNSVRAQGVRREAFTLIEIMVVVAIMGIVLAAGIPSIYNGMRKEGIRKAVSDVMEACEKARAQAIMTGRTSEVHFRRKTGRYLCSRRVRRVRSRKERMARQRRLFQVFRRSFPTMWLLKCWTSI